MGKPDDDEVSIAFSAMTPHSGNSYSGGDDNGGRGNKIQIAEKERKVIVLTKVLLLVALVTAIVALTYSTFKYVRDQEEQNFENEFNNMARKAIAVSAKNIQNHFETVEFFATTISAMVKESQMEWPKVVIPDWSAQAKRLAEMSGAQMCVLGTVVEEEERLDFEEWMRHEVHGHLQDAIDYLHLNATATELKGIPDQIAALNITTGEKIPETRPGPYLVNWHFYPFNPKRIFVNNNLLALRTNRNAFTTTTITRTASVSFAEIILGIRGQIFQPIFDNVESGKIVAVLWVTAFWAKYFENLLPPANNGMVAVLRSSCGFVSSFEINGAEAVNLGLEDFHDPKFDYMEVQDELFGIKVPDGIEVPDDVCLDQLTLHVFPSEAFKESYMTNEPLIFSGAVLLIFLVTLVLFVVYDVAVNRRQMKVMLRMNKQDKIVANIFPDQIMTRLFDDEDALNASAWIGGGASITDGTDHSESTDLLSGPRKKSSGPIADLFLESTVLYADIQGFVAWSSMREPGQIFVLLETLFSEFDKIARKYNVFKVETIADCYCASTGVPDPTPRHAVIMARFARSILDRASRLTKKLEVKLGPDTGDLEVRIGIHSGNVTAGILRGDRARYQLFGDTCNTASLIQSTGKSRKIHISDATAKLLKEAGKGKWLIERDEKISLGGHGMMQTHWLKNRSDMQAEKKHKANLDNIREEDDDEIDDTQRSSSMRLDDEEEVHEDKMRRLVDWNCDVLMELLEEVVAARQSKPAVRGTSPPSLSHLESEFKSHETVLEEFQEIITLPKTSTSELLMRQSVVAPVILPKIVRDQLHDLLTRIAGLYRQNEFHNYEHAAHVTASVTKMMKRITDTDNAHKAAIKEGAQQGGVEQPLAIQDLAGHSYGITSDPLTQFAVVFSSVIHDADHPGVTNAQLVEEQTFLAKKYNNKSVAEQNSVELVWSMLTGAAYRELRECIYTTEEELRRFRQLMVNIVMATDICDKELGALRKNRWNQAFSEEASKLVSPEDDMDRKATIVLEHLIQASDVSHTMQHWEIYLLWNERFFNECYKAFKMGRAASDPSVGWYKGEIGFFDFYIIPLAKKLESCGVFGVSSHEYLAYAEANRNLWEQKGEGIVEGYLERFHRAAEAECKLNPSAYTTDTSYCSSDNDSDLELGLVDGFDDEISL